MDKTFIKTPSFKKGFNFTVQFIIVFFCKRELEQLYETTNRMIRIIFLLNQLKFSIKFYDYNSKSSSAVRISGKLSDSSHRKYVKWSGDRESYLTGKCLIAFYPTCLSVLFRCVPQLI